MAYLASPAQTAAVLQKHGFHTQKRYGQNFLTDANILTKILDGAQVGPDDMVLEIGPGIGTMTQMLCERARKVVAVEIDDKLIPVLGDTLKDYDNVKVLHQDIMKTDLEALVREENGGKPIKIVANLPYYITTPILMALIEKNVPFISITVMVQTEVADRMQALPGTKDYGALSLAVQYHTKPQIIARVSPECFMPRPKVGSSVIRLTRYETLPVLAQDEKMMFSIIRAAFNQRRKTLVNALCGGGIADKEKVRAALDEMGLPETVRGETLSVSQFAKLSELLAFGKTGL